MKIKKITSTIFVLILVISFTALPLSVPFCLISHNAEEHHNATSLVQDKANSSYYFNGVNLKDNDKCCDDSGILVFNIDNHRELKNSANNYVLSLIFNSGINLLFEKNYSLKFIPYHFSPPQGNSNKLYKINSTFLI